MADMLFMNGAIWQAPGTSKSFPGGIWTMHHQRLPTDPAFLADITIQNAVDGSSYILLDGDTESIILSSAGTVVNVGGLFTVTAVPAFSSTYLVQLRLRESPAGGTRYRPYTQKFFHDPNGVSVFVEQQLSAVL